MPRFMDKEFPKLVSLAGQAALDPTRWQVFLESLAKPIGHATGALYAFKFEGGLSELNLNFGTANEFRSSYLEHYCHLNPYPQTTRTFQIGKVMKASATSDLEAIEKTAFYQEWMRPQGVPAEHFGIALWRDRKEQIVLAVAPHISELRRNGERYLHKLALLAPHVTQAIQINKALAKAERESRILDGVLEHFGTAVILLERGKVSKANASAQALFKSGVLRADKNGRVYPAHPRDESAFEGAVRKVALDATVPTTGPLELTSIRDGATYQVWFVRVFEGDAPTEPMPVKPRTGEDVPVMVVFAECHHLLRLPAAVLRSAFQLTAAEAELAKALAEGISLVDYAQSTGLSRNTLRNQLASIFAKTGTSRQGELVAKILSLTRWSRL